MITATHLTKAYGQTHALDDVSLSVDAGDIYGVVGTSGAGKSTLIRAINGLETPDSGTVEVDGTVITGLRGQALREARHRIGMIFQHFNLLGRRTVAGNVSLALEASGRNPADPAQRLGRAARAARVAEILELVGLSDRAGHFPAQLSGGQKQRVGIARALATNPGVLLSDEATSALDPETTASILDLLQSLNRELGLTILLITHEMDVVKQICTSAALMQKGRIVESGRLRDLLKTPGSDIARQLFPLGEAPVSPGSTVLDLTFTALTAHDPVIARLAREQGLDIGLLGAAIETIDGVQSGRTRLELPQGADVARAIESLRAQDIVVEVVEGARA